MQGSTSISTVPQDGGGEPVRTNTMHQLSLQSGRYTQRSIDVDQNDTVGASSFSMKSLQEAETKLRSASTLAHQAAQGVHGTSKDKIFTDAYLRTFQADFASSVRRSDTLSALVADPKPRVKKYLSPEKGFDSSKFASGAIITTQHFSDDPPPYSVR